MSAELFTVATRPTLGLRRLEKSLAKFSVPVTILGQDELEYWGHGWKWKTFVRAAKLSQAGVVVFCDAYDCLCLEALDSMLSKFAALSAPIVFSYEPQAQPEYWLALNSGLVMADRDALLEVFHDRCLEEFFPDHFNEQYQIQCMYAWNPEKFLVDKDGVLFHTASPRAPRLAVKNNRLTNLDTGKAPSFVHAPNGQDLSEVENLLAAIRP